MLHESCRSQYSNYVSTFNSLLKTSALNMNWLRKWVEQNAAAWPGHDWEESSCRSSALRTRQLLETELWCSESSDVSLMEFLMTVGQMTECKGWSKWNIQAQQGRQQSLLLTASWVTGKLPSLSFLIYKTGIIRVPMPQGCCRNEMR